jgi:alkylhydroperoxidase family enzyme
MPARVQPIQPPFPAFAQAWFERLMPPGVQPLALFTTLAADERLFGRFMSAGLLDRGHLTMRQREIVIARVTARCGSEYEWGVHTALFAERVRLNDAQIVSIMRGGPDDACWETADERCLLEICDALDSRCTLDQPLWDEARAGFTEPALMEILMLAGFYRMVSYLTNGLALPLEAWAARFGDYPRVDPD